MKIKKLNESMIIDNDSKITHCVYFNQDGEDQIEFEGTEEECNNYIKDIQAEQDDEFGDEAPERFVKRLDESADDQLKVGDKVFVTVNKKNGIVKKIVGDYITVETDDGKDPVRIDTYYANEVKKLDECSPVREDYRGRHDLDDIIGWLQEHKQAWDDFCIQFEDVDDEDLTYDMVIDWISEHDQLYDDFLKYFNEYDLDEAKKRKSSLLDRVNRALKEDIDTAIEEGPKEGPEFGLSSLINEAIQEELKTIDFYNSISVTAKAEGYEEIAALIDEINTEENKHVGQLQEALKSLSPNALAIEDGEAEGHEQLSNMSIYDDDLSDDELGMALFKLR